MTLRKGQKIANWIKEQGYSNTDVHVKLFYMSDKEFAKAVVRNRLDR